MEPEVIWSILGVILVIVEMMTVTFFAIFLAVGAFAAALVSFVTSSFTIQILVFITVSVLSFIFGKTFLSKFFKVNEEKRPSTINALIGQQGIVIKEILPLENGQVKVDGAIWTAISVDNQPISVNTKIEVIEINGVKLVVKTI